MKRVSDQPVAAALREIDEFLTSHAVLTLASVGKDGMPHAAALFFAHAADFTLYFLSEGRTQHGQDFDRQPEVAGTVQSDQDSWSEIRGLQMRGAVRSIPPGSWLPAITCYGRKFSFLAPLLSGHAGPAALAQALGRAQFYALRPEWMRLVDNRVAFGHKLELTRSGVEWRATRIDGRDYGD
jgi:uncharacterized protein